MTQPVFGKYLTRLNQAFDSEGARALSDVFKDQARDFGAYQVEATGGVQRPIRDKLGEVVSVEDFGATGDGTADDTDAFTKAAVTGKVVRLGNGKTYYLSSRISPVSGTHFVCDGIANIKIKTGTGGFNGTDLTVTKNGSAVCLFNFDAVDDIGIEGVRFTTDGVAERLVYPIRVQGGTGTKGCYFDRIEFFGLAVCNGAFLSLNTIGAGGYVVKNITGRSCGTSLTTWTGTPQLTVVEVDNDMLASVPSNPGYMENIRGIDVMLTGSALSTYGAQSDVLNIAGISGSDRKGPTVYGVYGDNVGEVVDLFCSHAVIKGVRARAAYNYAVKLVHGAQYNQVEIDTVESFGQAALILAGSSALTADTANNSIRIGAIKLESTIGSFSNVAAVFISDNGGGALTCVPKNNVVIVDKVVGDAVNLDYVIRDSCVDNGNDNLVIVGQASGWATAFCDANPNNCRIRVHSSSRVRMTMSATQALTTGVAATVQYNTAGTDIKSEAITASYKIRPKFPGPKFIKAQIRVALNANDDVTLRLQKNGTTIAETFHEPSTGVEYTYSVSTVDYVRENEVSAAASDYTVQALITSAGGITLLNNSQLVWFELTDLT